MYLVKNVVSFLLPQLVRRDRMEDMTNGEGTVTTMFVDVPSLILLHVNGAG